MPSDKPEDLGEPRPTERRGNNATDKKNALDQSNLEALVAALSAEDEREIRQEGPPPHPDDVLLEEPPEPDPVPLDDPSVDQSAVDSLLVGGDVDQLLVDKDPEAVIGLPASPDATIGQHDIAGLAAGADYEDAVLSRREMAERGETHVDALGPATQEEPKGEKPRQPSEAKPRLTAASDVPVSASADSALASAPSPPPDSKTGQGPEAVTTENLAAAVPEVGGSQRDSGLVSQDVLDKLLSEYKEKEQLEKGREPKASAAKPPEPVQPTPEQVPVEKKAPEPHVGETPFPEAEPPKGGKGRVRRVLRQLRAMPILVRANPVQGAVALAAGILVCVGTFLLLMTHPERTPDYAMLATSQVGQLANAMEKANRLAASGQYAEAARVLDGAIGNTPPSAERAEAEFVRLEMWYRALPAKPAQREAEFVHGEIDRLTEIARSHPRTPEALRWKGDLYERDDNLYGARTIYDDILANFGNAANLDEVLLAAAQVALRLNRPEEAADHMRRLLQQLPGSPLAGQAKLLLGDAYVAADEADAARELYKQVAQLQPNSPLGAQAFVRLGRLALDKGDYAEAISELETRLETATTIQGNDEVYLLLAEAYRAAGKLQEAANTLRELIGFFPKSEVTPLAFIALTQVLEQMGMRNEAVRLATQTAQDYPNHPEVLKNEAQLLLAAGNVREAARALLAADRAGAEEPAVLLAAARHFSTAKAIEEARDAYQRLIAVFPASPEAFEGAIELAQVRYDMGFVGDAMARLENLAIATEGRPQRLAVLSALGKLYADLGFDDRAAQVYGQIASMTTEPEMLAWSATALFQAGALDDGFTVVEKVDLTKVKDPTAYNLLMEQGKALLRVDSEDAVEKMQQAYTAYPSERTPEGDLSLLNAYLVTDRSARARALVMDLEAQVRLNPGKAPHLQRAAVAWADYLYEKRDYRAAADAYNLGIDIPNGDGETGLWARYQRANALLNLSDWEGSIALFDEVAASSVPWAPEARIKGDYARLEQRLRGLPVTSPKKEG